MGVPSELRMMCENGRYRIESDTVSRSLSLSKSDTVAQYGAAEVIFTIVKTFFKPLQKNVTVHL